MRQFRLTPDARDLGAGFVAGGGAAVGVAAAGGPWPTVLAIGMVFGLLTLAGSAIAAPRSEQSPAARKALAKQMFVLGCGLVIITLTFLAKNGLLS